VRPSWTRIGAVIARIIIDWLEAIVYYTITKLKDWNFLVLVGSSILFPRLAEIGSLFSFCPFVGIGIVAFVFPKRRPFVAASSRTRPRNRWNRRGRRKLSSPWSLQAQLRSCRHHIVAFEAFVAEEAIIVIIITLAIVPKGIIAKAEALGIPGSFAGPRFLVGSHRCSLGREWGDLVVRCLNVNRWWDHFVICHFDLVVHAVDGTLEPLFYFGLRF
jgi:hypothetical protein